MTSRVILAALLAALALPALARADAVYGTAPEQDFG